MKGSLMLTPDPTDEQLARDWTLSEKDRIEVRRARGAAHRYRFAIQLCVLRNEGRFLDRYDNVPMRIVNHLGRQLHLPAVLLLEAPDRAKTETEQQQRIRQHLGYVGFDPRQEKRLREWLANHAADQILSTGPDRPSTQRPDIV